MYSQSHLKRILPRRDEQFRTNEFPSQYYSNSSVYSYSPTSSSDCPEHGRSHRRTKIILTVSVTLATLGVLSIAGVAVYLGLLSKNINYGSQYEESYLYSTAVNPKVSAPTGEDLFQMPNGRSRSDFFPDDPVDLTNRLEESVANHPQTPPEDTYLNSKPNSQVFYTQRNSTSIFYQNKAPSSPGPTGVPSPVIVSSERILAAPHPVDLQSPLIILGPTPKRNKSTTNPYNVQSTVTNERVTVHFGEEDNTGTLITKQQQTVNERRPIVVPTMPSHHPRETTTSPINTKTIGTAVTTMDTVHVHVQDNDDDRLGSLGQGVTRSDLTAKPELTPSVPHMSSLEPSLGQATRPMRPSQTSVSASEGFYPVNPPNYGQPPTPSTDLMSNHKVQLTFDRVSPDFYDKKPWTPLLIRPAQQLDKRPRVEGIVPLVSSGESEETYYSYGGTAVENSKGKPPLRMMTPVGDGNNNGTVGMGGDKEPIRHGQGVMDYSTINSDEEGEEDEVDNPVTYLKESDNHEEIPAYTVSIPHIPNEFNRSVVTTSGDLMPSLNGDTEGRTGTGDAEIGEKAAGPYADSEEYEEEDDEEGGGDDEKGPIETKVYTLDPTNTDMFPQPVEIGPQPPVSPPELDQEPPLADEQEMARADLTKPEVDKDAATGSEHNGTTDESRPMKSTTDLILSTLGSLNLVKAKSPGDMLPEEIKGNPVPLFPPTRSYISVHLPLRNKPAESESEEVGDSEEKIFLIADAEKKLRLVDSEGLPLAPDLTSTSSLNKVLSMMMTVDDSSNPGAVLNLLRDNVKLVVANHSGSIGSSVRSDAVSAPLPNKSREHKSFTRDPKIDSRFRDPEMQKIPVPLILETPAQPTSSANQKTGIRNDENKTWIPTKLTSLTVNKYNSPVYKFILRKGQSVEDLLKEIFRNYTDKNIGGNHSKEEMTIPVRIKPIEVVDPLPLGIQLATKYHVLDQTTTERPTTPAPVTSPTPTTPRAIIPTTTIDSVFKTSTSVVVNEEVSTSSASNGTFRCASTGVILSSFARCNSIKECADNSDEKNCDCVDYLKSQLLHRKICDGIVDCADESDENHCDWCKPGQYICSASRVCVPREKICDSRRDCPRGDDEANCVKIGPSGLGDELEDISPIYHKSGYLMVRKKGIWGKLCVETFSSVLSHWEIKDLARAVCKAKTFTDFESVEKVVDPEEIHGEPYYELFNSGNETDSDEENLYSSDESTPRSGIGFKVSKCTTRMVVKVRCHELQCGTAPRAFTQAARIVGGSNAIPGGWPWQAALYRDGEYQCGATLISGRWLLSAGHCFYHAQDDYWVARLGTLRRGATFLSPYEQVIKITHVFLHPQYKDIGFVNDVSLLRLEKEVNFTDFVRPVCLPEKETEIRDGRICTVVGWGQLFETGRVFPDTLQEVQLPLISTAECRKRTLFLPLYKLTDEMFCAGFDRGGRDACLGDSGGPLMCPESDGRWSLYGVTSNGYGCARANRPGVYTKTKSYLDWVFEKINQDSSFTFRDKTKPCSGHRCLLGECLEPRSVCNGISDCVDGSDERNCTWS